MPVSQFGMPLLLVEYLPHCVCCIHHIDAVQLAPGRGDEVCVCYSTLCDKPHCWHTSMRCNISS